ncbi:MAG: RluA family pseudouridine synthase [Clostridia bacterium]|nr:RluA family pseudouridine synthase [Clostridia bacterium]
MPRILYQDDHLLLVEKPVGLSSQEVDGGGDSLPHRLSEQGLPVLPVHRLDTPTGGVMVYARTKAAAAKLSALVGEHEVFAKEYLAVVQGIPEPEGELTDLLYHDVRKNKSFPVKRERKGVRLARLTYTCLSTVALAEGTFSLVRVRLHTGRTHQIRVQFASRQMPLYGDTRYGGIKAPTLGLWSYRLTFPHPVGGKPVCALSYPPATPPFVWFNLPNE